jgi:hypothetical protein
MLSELCPWVLAPLLRVLCYSESGEEKEVPRTGRSLQEALREVAMQEGQVLDTWAEPV